MISPVNIVNGCQTANSIYNVSKTSEFNEDNVKIPVRIIVADDQEYQNITISTNTQNGLEAKDLNSITNIQKELQELFRDTKIAGKSFYYKRQKSSTETEVIPDVDYIVHILYLISKFVSKRRNINLFETYFRENIDDALDKEELNTQNNLIQEIYSALYDLIKKYEDFSKVLQYITNKIKTDYPNLLNIKTKAEEKILYKSVEKLKRTRVIPVFINFDTVFNKNIEDIIKVRNDKK